MKHKYDDLLRTIIRTIKNDYAGFPEKMERHDSRYYVNTTGTAFKQGNLDELLFLRIVSQYLASLGDPNLKFSMADHEDYKNYCVGFRARRYGNDLYVTECAQDQRLKVGDKITAINQLPPGGHRAKFRKNILIGNTAEREQWSGFLKMADHFEVEHSDGTKEDLSFEHFELLQPEYKTEFRSLTEDVCYLCIEEFSPDTTALETLLQKHEMELRTCSRLILDLRKNEGGAESGFVPLLPLVIDHPVSLTDLFQDPVYTNYTNENCERRIREFQVLKNLYAKESQEDAARLCDDLIQEYQKKAGSGLCAEAADDELQSKSHTTAAGASCESENSNKEQSLIRPYENIQKIVLITDTWCRDAGEIFVKLCSGFSKVSIIGRPTMGTIDYTNSVTMLLDQTFVLSYPMSKRGYVLNDTRYNDTGLPVDLYIPWTPQECTEDVLLQKALNISSSFTP